MMCRATNRQEHSRARAGGRPRGTIASLGLLGWLAMVVSPLLGMGSAAAASTVRLVAETQQGNQVERQVIVTSPSGTYESLQCEVTYDVNSTVPTVQAMGSAASATLLTNVRSAGVLAVGLANSSALPSGQVVLSLRYPGTANPSVPGPVRLLNAIVDEQTATPITEPIADLVVSTLATSSPPLTPGASLSLSNAVQNAGGATAGAFTVSFSLSTDQTAGGANDLAFPTTRSVSSLNAGASSSVTTTLTIPTTTPVRSYFVCAQADSANVLIEGDETNNGRCTSTALSVAPTDLVLSVLSPNAASANAGGGLSVANTAANPGAALSRSFTIAFRLSPNQIYGDADDVVIPTTRTVTSLAIGGSSPATTSVTIPATTRTGSYYVCAKADSANVVLETNETNNTRCSTTTVTLPPPDLIVSALFTSATTVSRGTSLSLANSVKNQGGAAMSTSATVAFHLSGDASYGGSDDVGLATTRASGVLAAGGTSSVTTTLPIPATTPVGPYFVCALADSTNVIAEGTETNNSRCTMAAITVQ